jgi:hypothetical protein
MELVEYKNFISRTYLLTGIYLFGTYLFSWIFELLNFKIKLPIFITLVMMVYVSLYLLMSFYYNDYPSNYIILLYLIVIQGYILNLLITNCVLPFILTIVIYSYLYYIVRSKRRFTVMIGIFSVIYLCLFIFGLSLFVIDKTNFTTNMNHLIGFIIWTSYSLIDIQVLNKTDSYYYANNAYILLSTHNIFGIFGLIYFICNRMKNKIINQNI